MPYYWWMVLPLLLLANLSCRIVFFFWHCNTKLWLKRQPGSHTKYEHGTTRNINTAHHTHEHILCQYASEWANYSNEVHAMIFVLLFIFLGFFFVFFLPGVQCASYSILITSSYINLQLILCFLLLFCLFIFVLRRYYKQEKPEKNETMHKNAIVFLFCMFDAFSLTLRLVNIVCLSSFLFFLRHIYCSPFQPLHRAIVGNWRMANTKTHPRQQRMNWNKKPQKKRRRKKKKRQRQICKEKHFLWPKQIE